MIETDVKTAGEVDFLSGGGDMGARMRSFDWSATPLGPPEHFPQSLRSALSVCLGSRFPIVIYWGAEYTVLYNDAYAEILGKKHPWALGRSCREVWSEIWSVIAPMLDGVLATGEATWSDDQLLFLERRGYPEECYFSFSFSPVRGASGAVDGIFTAVIENTRRVVGERRLRVLRDLGARTGDAKTAEDACAIAAATLAAHDKDVPFALLYLVEGDRARLAGASGVSVGEHISPREVHLGSPGDFPWPMAEAMRAEAVLVVERLSGRFSSVPRGPWSDAPHTAVITPIPSSKPHEATGLMVAGVSARLKLDEYYRDFFALVGAQIATSIMNARAHEEEKKRAEALAEIDRAKTAFFSNVSHEFRTPLALMLGPIEDLLRQVDGGLSAEARGRLEVAHRNSLRLLKLVNSLLDFSRIEAGRIEASYEPTDLVAFTNELASVFRSVIERAGLRLIIDCPPIGEDVFVDREMWEKIVFNLLSNAFKFTFEGEIEVCVRLDGERAMCSVRDTGIGIPSAELPHLFERFHRVRGARARTFEGSGIGLALVEQLVRLHAGTVTVESEVDRGSCFTVSIPLGSAHLPADRIAGARALASTAVRGDVYLEEASRWLPSQDGMVSTVNGSDTMAGPTSIGAPRPRILLADDNADMRAYVHRLLTQEYDVEAVPDGAAALRAARMRMPDLVLTDVMMPELDGVALLTALRADEQLHTIPVILLSARAGEDARVEGMRAGATDYLTKPFSARELLARVRANIDMARLRAEAQRQLRESEARFRILADTAPTMLWVTEPDGSCSFVSRSLYDYTGQTEAQTLGRGWLDAVHPDDRAEASEKFLSANAGRQEFKLDYRLRRRDGEHRWVLDAGRPRFAASGEFLGFVGSVIDIHERRQAALALRESETRLREVDRRKDEFLATLAHELRNPLAPLRYSLHLLRQVAPQDSFGTPLHEMMERQVQHLVRLVDDLLEVSRISRGTLELRRERVELAAVVRNAIETSTPLVQSRSRRLDVALPDEPLLIDGDPVRLAQVLANLLNNAAQHTPPDGQIALRAERQGDWVSISVRDNGAGIPAELLPHLFEMFSRGPQSNQSKDGLGIGLALARRLVEMHGGTIEARSDGPNSGSEFTVRLPIALAGSEQPAPLPPDVGHAGGGPQRVLIVDDNRDVAQTLAAVLQLLGAQVRVAHDGPTALQSVQAFEPSLILLDIGLPGMDGYEIARRIRSEAQGVRPTIVAVTGWGQEADRRKTSAAGFDRHLVKPVEPRMLQQLLSGLEEE